MLLQQTNKQKKKQRLLAGNSNPRCLTDLAGSGLGDLSLTQNITLLLTVELHDILAFLCEVLFILLSFGPYLFTSSPQSVEFLIILRWDNF